MFRFHISKYFGVLYTSLMPEYPAVSSDGSLDIPHGIISEHCGINTLIFEDLQTLPNTLYTFCGYSGTERHGNSSVRIEWTQLHKTILGVTCHIRNNRIRISLENIFNLLSF